MKDTTIKQYKEMSHLERAIVLLEQLLKETDRKWTITAHLAKSLLKEVKEK